MSTKSSQDLLFASDAVGNVTHLRGIEKPGLLFHVFAATSLSERAPMKDTAWVVRGMYKFARRVQGVLGEGEGNEGG